MHPSGNWFWTDKIWKNKIISIKIAIVFRSKLNFKFQDFFFFYQELIASLLPKLRSQNIFCGRIFIFISPVNQIGNTMRFLISSLLILLSVGNFCCKFELKFTQIQNSVSTSVNWSLHRLRFKGKLSREQSQAASLLQWIRWKREACQEPQDHDGDKR